MIPRTCLSACTKNKNTRKRWHDTKTWSYYILVYVSSFPLCHNSPSLTMQGEENSFAGSGGGTDDESLTSY